MNRPLLSCIVAACLAFVPAMAAAEASDIVDNQHVSQLLTDAKSQAYQLKEDAWLLESFTRGAATSAESHAAVLNQVREHANTLFKTLTKLEDSRGVASPWQVVAIDRISPLLKELSTNTTATINFINKNRNKLNTPEYKDYVELNAALASDMAGLVRDFVSYGKVKKEFERLTTKLELN